MVLGCKLLEGSLVISSKLSVYYSIVFVLDTWYHLHYRLKTGIFEELYYNWLLVISVLQKNRDSQKPLVKKFNGEFLKEMGDGVNVASRIEQLADAGGIFISGQVYTTIKNKPGIEALFLGEKQLKNVGKYTQSL